MAIKLCTSTWLKSFKLLVNNYSFQPYNKIYFRCSHEMHNVMRKEKVEKSHDTKLIKVAIIGLPNAGKSTLINNLMDRKVCPTSAKVHTTRKKTNAIITEGNTQVVFLDTPGVISNAEQKKFKLEKAFFKDCETSLMQTDLIGVVHDVSNAWTKDRLDIKLIRLLERYKKKKSFLILNKIDMLKSKRKLLDITRNLTYNFLNSVPKANVIDEEEINSDIKGWVHFSEVFMVSALLGDGITDLKNYLIRNAYPSEWMYPSTEWTNQSPHEIIIKTVQAVLLDFLPQEIPYGLKTEMEFLEMSDDGTIICTVLVHCPQERIRKLVVGVGDGKLRQITERVQRDLTNTFHTLIRLRIIVSCRENKKK